MTFKYTVLQKRMLVFSITSLLIFTSFQKIQTNAFYHFTNIINHKKNIPERFMYPYITIYFYILYQICKLRLPKNTSFSENSNFNINKLLQKIPKKIDYNADENLAFLHFAIGSNKFVKKGKEYLIEHYDQIELISGGKTPKIIGHFKVVNKMLCIHKITINGMVYYKDDPNWFYYKWLLVRNSLLHSKLIYHAKLLHIDFSELTSTMLSLPNQLNEILSIFYDTFYTEKVNSGLRTLLIGHGSDVLEFLKHNNINYKLLDINQYKVDIYSFNYGTYYEDNFLGDLDEPYPKFYKMIWDSTRKFAEDYVYYKNSKGLKLDDILIIEA